MSAGPAGARALGGALADNSSLTFLALGSCKLRAQGAIDLVGGAQQNSTLAVLLLCKNNIGDKGACALADFVGGSGLQRLALSSNNIKHTGALALAKGCSKCKVRTRLSCCERSHAAEHCLCEGHVGADALRHSDDVQSLRDLDIKLNEPGSQAVAALLSWPHGLQSLDLSSSALQPPDASSALQQWASSAGKNALTHVALAGNALTDKTLQPLCAALLANRKLECVDLAACQLGAEAGRKLHSLAQSIGQIRAAGGRHHALKVRTYVHLEHSNEAIIRHDA